jgi:hypothetical protein
MSLFGKILAILNVVAAIAFFFLAMMDYASRQGLGRPRPARIVQMQGLPVDDKEPDVDGQSRRRASRRLPDQPFKDAGGDPSRTQVQEVEKVKRTFAAARRRRAGGGHQGPETRPHPSAARANQQ